MDDLDKYIETRKKQSPKFAKHFDKGYEQFKIGILLKQARLEAGLTQEQVANKLRTRKSAISRIEKSCRRHPPFHIGKLCSSRW